jgi:hypothetical protein
MTTRVLTECVMTSQAIEPTDAELRENRKSAQLPLSSAR